MCFGGGGPSISSMLNQLNQLAETSTAWMNRGLGAGVPFQEQVVAGGIPGMGTVTDASMGTTAQGFAPAEGALQRNLAAAGLSPNDPRAIQQTTDLGASEGRAFDQTLLNAILQNFAARSGASQNLIGAGTNLNPLAAYQSILQTQLQR
jgi:hypothetical protein